MYVSFWIDWHVGCQANNNSFWCLKHLIHTYQPHTFHNHFQKTHIAFQRNFIYLDELLHPVLLFRGIPLEKSTLWTKSYTRAKMFISTQTPGAIMSLCKLSAALGTMSPLTSSLGGLSRVSYRLGWTSPPGKTIPVTAVIQLFCSNRTRKKHKNPMEAGSQHGTRWKISL